GPAAPPKSGLYAVRRGSLHDLLEAASGRLLGGVGGDADLEPLGVRQPAGGVDAQQLVHAADEVTRVDRAIFDGLASGVGGPDHPPPLKAAAADHGGEHRAVVGAAAVPGRLPGDPGGPAELPA